MDDSLHALRSYYTRQVASVICIFTNYAMDCSCIGPYASYSFLRREHCKSLKGKCFRPLLENVTKVALGNKISGWETRRTSISNFSSRTMLNVSATVLIVDLEVLHFISENKDVYKRDFGGN